MRDQNNRDWLRKENEDVPFRVANDFVYVKQTVNELLELNLKKCHK